MLTDDKCVYFLKLTPPTVIDTMVQQPHNSYYKQYKPRERLPFSDSETNGLIKFGKYKEVLNNNLCLEHNRYFRPHQCKLS